MSWPGRARWKRCTRSTTTRWSARPRAPRRWSSCPRCSGLDFIVTRVGGGGLLLGPPGSPPTDCSPASRCLGADPTSPTRHGPFAADGRAAASPAADDDRRRVAHRPLRPDVRDHPRPRAGDRHRLGGGDPRCDAGRVAVHEAGDRAVGRGCGRRGSAPLARAARVGIILSGGNVDLDPMFDTLR